MEPTVSRQHDIEEAQKLLRDKVASMRRTGDILDVLVLLGQQLNRLGVKFEWCRLLVGHLDASLAYLCNVVTRERSRRLREAGTPVRDRSLLDDLTEESEVITFIPGPPDIPERFDFTYWTSPNSKRNPSRRGVFNRTQEQVEKNAKGFAAWKPKIAWPPDMMARSLVEVPFSGGGVEVQTTQPDAYTSRDLEVVTALAEAVSLGFTRFLDLQRLEKQNRDLAKANQVKSEFLANVSHELRTPMNAIINFAALILEGFYGQVSLDLRDAVEEIDRSGEQLLKLINDVLDVSKIEAGAMQLQLADCVPQACIETAIAALEQRAREKGLRLVKVVDGDLPLLVADERRITQHVLMNLVKNAIKFTHEGEVRVGAHEADGQVLFWVSDTGIGIAKEEHERIFETFYQVDGSITREAEGTGLGLAIAWKFVEMHGGRIWVESEPERGSTFRFTIPVKK